MNVTESTHTQIGINPLNGLPQIRWSEQRVLAEARQRTKDALDKRTVRRELARLIVTSGWNESDFIDALCRDVVRRNASR